MSNKVTRTRTFSKRTTIEWTKDNNRNLLFIYQCLSYCQEKLRYNGYLFLNDVLGELGMKLVEDGYNKGWIFEKGKELDWQITDHKHSKDGNIKIILKNIIKEPMWFAAYCSRLKH